MATQINVSAAAVTQFSSRFNRLFGFQLLHCEDQQRIEKNVNVKKSPDRTQQDIEASQPEPDQKSLEGD